MGSPCPCWYRTCSQQLLGTHLHVVLLEGLILLDNREPHLALPSSRFFFCSQLLDSGSQADSKRFHAIGQRHSFFTSELTQLVLQEPHEAIILLFPSFPSSVTDNLRPCFLDFFIQLLHHLLCHFNHFSVFPQQECRDVIHKNPQLQRRVKFF